MIGNEDSVFERFKFNVGDLVVHVTGDTAVGVIRERILAQTSSGTYKAYEVVFRDGSVFSEEMELLPASNKSK